VTVSVRDARGSQSDRLWIENVYRDYLDDLAPLNTGIFPILPEVGHREPDVRTLTGWRRAVVGDELLALLRGERTVAVGDGGHLAIGEQSAGAKS